MNKFIKKILIILIFVIVGTLIYYIFYFKKEVIKADSIALVNGEKINLELFKSKLSDIKNSYKKEKISDLNKVNNIKETILRRLISNKLIIQEARIKNIKITDEELNRYANNIRKNISDESFKQLLVEQFITEDIWMNDLREKLLIEKCLSKIIIEKIKLTENEIEEYYSNYYKNKISKSKVKLAQVFTYSKEQALLALEDIKDGELFTNVAIKYSKSPEAIKGGYLGEITKGTSIDVFDIGFQMKEGEVSEIIQSNYGYHIIKLIEIVPSGNISFIEAKPYIFNEIINKKEKIIYEKWLENKLRNSKILINKALLNSIY